MDNSLNMSFEAGSDGKRRRFVFVYIERRPSRVNYKFLVKKYNNPFSYFLLAQIAQLNESASMMKLSNTA